MFMSTPLQPFQYSYSLIDMTILQYIFAGDTAATRCEMCARMESKEEVFTARRRAYPVHTPSLGPPRQRKA